MTIWSILHMLKQSIPQKGNSEILQLEIESYLHIVCDGQMGRFLVGHDEFVWAA